jgi:hypothetical protein
LGNAKVGHPCPTQGEKVSKVTCEEIEQRFVDAGWELDGSFADHLIIGYSGDHVSLLAHQEVWNTEDPVFEIQDHEEIVTYWVKEIPKRPLGYSKSMARRLTKGTTNTPEEVIRHHPVRCLDGVEDGRDGRKRPCCVGIAPATLSTKRGTLLRHP